MVVTKARRKESLCVLRVKVSVFGGQPTQPQLLLPPLLAGCPCVSKVAYVHCLSRSVINKLSGLHQIVWEDQRKV